MSIHFSANLDWPDATGGIPCCMGYALDGPGGCTCWEPIFDLEQQPVQEHLPVKERGSMCHDCAFRKDSPERTGADGYGADQETLDDLVWSGRQFLCHQGSRRVLMYRHPGGMEINAHPADYDPPQCRNTQRAFKADGTPQDICAGWSKMRRKAVKAKDEVVS